MVYLCSKHRVKIIENLINDIDRSLGCILYELLVGSPPFCTTSLLQLIRKIRYETVPWPTNLSADCFNLLQGLLEKDPRRRLTWPHLLEHPFLENKVLLPPEKRIVYPFSG